MSARTTGILGGGALGLTAAYRLANLGDRVTVIEREPEAGGLAAGFRVATGTGGEAVYLEKFYHHLFRADHAAVELIEELGLGSRLVWPAPVSAMLRDGRIYRIGPVDLLRLTPLPVLDRFRMAAVLAYLKAEKVYGRLEGYTAAEWLRRWMGRPAYEVFAEPLLRQKFGEHAEQIGMPWFWSRVHLRSGALGYLRGGFQQLYTRLADRIVERGGAVHLSTAISNIAPQRDGTIVVAAGDQEHRFDRVLSTLPAAVTFALTPSMPESFRRAFSPGPALSAHCLVLELDRRFSDVYWIAINDPGYPFLAVVEHTNYMDAAEYEGKRLLYVGNYVPPDHPLMRQSTEETIAQFAPYLQRINPAFSRHWITGAHSFGAPFAQPVVSTDYREHIAPHTTPIANLFLANMFQIYPQDRGQNYSIAMADRVVRTMQRTAAAAVPAPAAR